MKRNKEGKEVSSTLTLLPSTLCSATISLILGTTAAVTRKIRAEFHHAGVHPLLRRGPLAGFRTVDADQRAVLKGYRHSTTHRRLMC